MKPASTPKPPRPHGMGDGRSLARATAAGLAWLMFQSVGTRAVTFAGQLVVGWLLNAEDFGVIGLVYTLTTFIEALVNFGLDDVLLQRQRTIRLWAGAAFWISFALGMLGMVMLLIAAPITARLYGVPRLAGVADILAIALPIGALATVPVIGLRAALDFRFLAASWTCELFAVQCLTILFAWAGCGVYAFAMPIPIMASVRVVVMWSKTPLAFRKRWRASQAKYLVQNGAVVFGRKFVTNLIAQGDYITLGLFAAPSAVGTYYFAFRLAAQPVRMLGGNFQNVLIPTLSRMRDDPRRQGAAAFNAALILSSIIMPFCFMQAAVAAPLFHLLFGAKWTAAVPLFQILSLGLPFDAVSWIAGALLDARGEFRRGFAYIAAMAPVFFGLVAFGAWQAEAQGVAIAVALFYCTMPPVLTWVAFRRAGLSRRRLAGLYATPTILALIATGIAVLVSTSAVPENDPLLRMAATGAVGSCVYAFALYAINPMLFHEIVERLGLHRHWARARLALGKMPAVPEKP